MLLVSKVALVQHNTKQQAVFLKTYSVAILHYKLQGYKQIVFPHLTVCMSTYSLAVTSRMSATTVDLVSLVSWPTMDRPR